MRSAPIRILVAEDYEPFRRFLSSTLQSRANLRVICEVADGSEAVQKVGELRPDLVLLDIGLPGLNGIEAARQIRAVSPDSKILFVSQESSLDFVDAAIETGAQGYVCKIDGGGELLPAIEAILLGRKYLSRSIATSSFVEASPASILMGEYNLIPDPLLRDEESWYHEVGFYPDNRSLWDARINFVRDALKGGNAAALIASESHHREFLSRLQVNGVDVRAAIEQGRYIALNVADALSRLMVNNLPDPIKFSKLVGELITKAAIGVDGDISRVFVCGEGTTLLWEQGHEEGLIQLEHLWDELARKCGLHVHCGYLLHKFHSKSGKVAFGRICAEHSVVLAL
jgi:DNA-binding NarL/FixJ family response regulator